MNIRNFWIEAFIDGRKTKLVGGPRGRYGGINIVIYMRDSGTVKHVAGIVGHTSPGGHARPNSVRLDLFMFGSHLCRWSKRTER